MDFPSLSTFHAIAAIGATLTGFIGVVVALQMHDRHFPRLVLGTMFGTSMGATMFAFLPELIGGFMEVETAWRLATGLFGAYHLFLILNHQIRQRSIQSNSPIQLAITLSSFPVVFSQIGVGFGFFVEYAYALYLLGLLWLIGVTAYLFALTLSSEVSSDL